MPFGFQSTRPVWGATQFIGTVLLAQLISIHAPRVGRDCAALVLRARHRISIHAPRVGRDMLSAIWYLIQRYFNPRAPCGARPPPCWCPAAAPSISIHAPRVGRDSKFDDFTPLNLHKRYKRVLARPKNAREKRKNKAKTCLHSRIFGLFGVRRFRNLLRACTSHPIPLDHQRAFGIIARFGAEMLDAGVILIPKVVKAQTVHGFIHDRA